MENIDHDPYFYRYGINDHTIINMYNNETIAAIATGPVSSGISIIRVSGPDAVAAVDSIFIKKKNNNVLKQAKTHTIHYGFIVNADKEIIDEVLVSVMKGPKSYTAEDVIEINCHGGNLVTKQVLDAVINAGARLAEPGEFTKRAFLNGRIDLTEAESVMDLISASSKVSLSNSEKMLSGFLKDKITEYRKVILHESAYIESALDDPEHFDLTDYPLYLNDVIKNVISKIDDLIDSADEGQIIKNGIRAVILGKPNVGKSTFLNVLLGRDKAIVTDIAGTTRDTLDEALSINGIPFVITDTAGIRDTDDPVEKIGVEKARQAAKGADLILYVADKINGFDEEDVEILDNLKDKKVIILMNKSDLDENGDDQFNKAGIADSDKKNFEIDITGKYINKTIIKDKYLSKINKEEQIKILSISAKERTGIDEFKNLVKDMFFKGKLDSGNDIYITNLRHKEALIKTKASLENVIRAIEDEMSEDFYTIDLMDAYTYLGQITGEEVSDDLVEEIFSKFCMGK